MWKQHYACILATKSSTTYIKQKRLVIHYATGKTMQVTSIHQEIELIFSKYTYNISPCDTRVYNTQAGVIPDMVAQQYATMSSKFNQLHNYYNTSTVSRCGPIMVGLIVNVHTYTVWSIMWMGAQFQNIPIATTLISFIAQGGILCGMSHAISPSLTIETVKGLNLLLLCMYPLHTINLP